MTPASRRLLLLLQFVCPLLFFTDLTRNPYYSQIVLLHVGAFAALALAAAGAWSSGAPLALPRTALDPALAAWVGVCALSWAASWAGHAAALRPAIISEGSRAFWLLGSACVLPFYFSATIAEGLAAEPRLRVGRWALFFVLWGAAWLLFPQLRGSTPMGAGVAAHLWDPYGTALWLCGGGALLALGWEADAHSFWHVFLGVGWLASVYGIGQYFSFDPIWPRLINPYGGRCVSTFGNPNFLSSYLVLLTPVAGAYYLRARDSLSRLVYAVCLLTFEAALLSTLTRSSWLGAALGAAALFLSPALRARLRDDLPAHGLVACLGAAMVVAWPQSTLSGYVSTVIQRVGEIREAFGGGTYSPLHQRMLIWACAWLMGAENPLLGKGWGTFELFYPFYQGPLLDALPLFRVARTHANNAHNELLEAWSQTGILGLGVWAWLWTVFAAAARRLLKRRPEESAALPLAAAAGAAGMLADNLLNVSAHFAVPGMLLWWQLGAALGSASRGEGQGSRRVPGAWAAGLAALLLAGAGWSWGRQWARECLYFMGFKAARRGEVSRSIELLEAAHRWSPREVNTDYELGNAYARSGQDEKARWAYEEALAANPGYDEIHFNLATILMRMKDAAGARRHYRVAWAINPLSPAVYQNLAALDLSDSAGPRGELIELWESQLRMFPDDPQVMNNLAYAYLLRGDLRRAEDLYSRALRLRPDLALAETNLRAAVRKQGGPPPPILGDLDRCHELESRLRARDYGPRALSLARGLLGAFPESPACQFYAGTLELAAGDPAAAARMLERAAQGQPRNIPILLNLAVAYMKTGRPAQAQEQARAVLELDPNNGQAKAIVGAGR